MAKKETLPKSVIIENVYPELDSGRFPVKRIQGETVEVYADIFKEGHDTLLAFLKYRKYPDRKWKKVKMEHIDNDRHSASFTLEDVGIYEYTIEGYPEVNKSNLTEYDRILKIYSDRKLAETAAWYEMWPRSQGKEETKSATFADMEKRLPEIQEMGFDVVYLTPIHPVGKTARKGKNNAIKAEPGDPGCPYAVGNEDGGHKTIEPSLGTIKEFIRFVKASNKMGMEIAIDIAHTCSPDHPYVKEHPEWFYRKPDGTIECAKNPPKIYEDIYPLNFFSPDWKNLWAEMLDIFVFWIDKGVKVFRIDNPHTKPFGFWRYILDNLKEKHPEVILLSEAFTKPKVMKRLAKEGFGQSYTYFTWRNYRQEMTEYLSEITGFPVNEYFRGNLFTNTPDILPFILQQGGRPAFKMRFALAATLSSVYGIYNGFELCENAGIPGKEEYLNSEKYEFKVRDWDREGNIKDYITKINGIRKENHALLYYKNLRFYFSDNKNVIFYGKTSPEGKSSVFVAVNMDPYNEEQSTVSFPLNELGIAETEFYKVTELITGAEYNCKTSKFLVKLKPEEPAAIFRIEKGN